MTEPGGVSACTSRSPWLNDPSAQEKAPSEMFLKTRSGSFEVSSSPSADFKQLGSGSVMDKQAGKIRRARKISLQK